MTVTEQPNQTDKLEALGRVLHSRTFQRSEQLRAFLKFVVDHELEGRGAELSEYRIGADGLGRGSGFLPHEDGVVRNRAHALREKLDLYYSEENPADPLRIELPKGSYRPAFRVPGDSPAEVPVAPLAMPPPAAQSRKEIPGRTALAFGFGVLAALAVMLAWPSPRAGAGKLDPGVREVFGPMLERDRSVLVCLATPVHMVLRPVPTRVNPGSPTADGNPWLGWYASRRSVPDASELYLRPSPTSLFWGDAIAALTLVQALSREGIPVEILQEQNLSLPALRGRNVILIGRSEYSELVKSHLRDTAFEVAYVPEIQETGVVVRHARPGETDRYLPRFNDKQELANALGLVTVLPAKGPDLTPRRTIILSGTTSPGTQAAAEFITNGRYLEELLQRLHADGHKKLPAAFQIVVQANVQGTSVLDVAYAAHSALDNPEERLAAKRTAAAVETGGRR